jgi:hypothetical protein
LLLCFFPPSLPACVLGHSICIIEDMVMELSYHDVRWMDYYFRTLEFPI